MANEATSKLFFNLIRVGDLEGVKKLVEKEGAALLNEVASNGWTALHHAAYHGREQVIKWLLSSDEGGGRAAGFTMILAKTAKGSTALHLAASNGELECCQALVEGSMVDNGERAEVLNAVNNEGWTVLHFAAKEGQWQIIKWLLSSSYGGGRAAGFNMVLARTEIERTAMHFAARFGFLECCQALVEGSLVENGERAELLNGADKKKWTALHLAVFSGHLPVIKWLLSADGGRASGFTSVLARIDDEKSTAMHIAAQSGQLECCRALVEGSIIETGERAELLNAVNSQGWTALHQAVSRKHLSIVQWLLSSSGGRAAGFTSVLAKTTKGSTALHFAAQCGCLMSCKALMEGNNVGEKVELLNAADQGGWTALHHAADKAHLSIIQWILSSDDGGGRAAGFTNVLAKTNKGWTALHHAVGRGLLECCQALVEGSNIENGERVELLNAVNDQGWTVLHVAAHESHTHLVKWLLSSSAEGAGFSMILARDKYGVVALHLAAEVGDLESCRALVEACKSEERAEMLNAVNDNGNSVLHYASSGSHTPVIKWFLSADGGRAAGFTNVLAKMEVGYTALHTAAANGYLDCCQALVEGCNDGEREALLNAVDYYGATALHHCCNFGRPLIIEWLLSSDEGGGRAAGFTSSSVTARSPRTLNTGRSALHSVVESGDVDALNALLSGCTPAERLTLFLCIDEPNQWTALHLAACVGFGDIIRELLLHYPETQTIVDARDHRGMTALHRAVIGGIDEESKKEWEEGMVDNISQTEIISALLIAPKKDDEDNNQQAAMVDPNLGIKV